MKKSNLMGDKSPKNKTKQQSQKNDAATRAKDVQKKQQASFDRSATKAK